MNVSMKKMSAILKSLVVSYIITIAMLLVLTFLLFQFELDEGKVSVGIILVYLLSCFIGGFFAGKKCGSRKFLWGLAVGGIYFTLLLVQKNGRHKSNKKFLMRWKSNKWDTWVYKKADYVLQ